MCLPAATGKRPAPEGTECLTGEWGLSGQVTWLSLPRLNPRPARPSSPGARSSTCKFTPTLFLSPSPASGHPPSLPRLPLPPQCPRPVLPLQPLDAQGSALLCRGPHRRSTPVSTLSFPRHEGLAALPVLKGARGPGPHHARWTHLVPLDPRASPGAITSPPRPLGSPPGAEPTLLSLYPLGIPWVPGSVLGVEDSNQERPQVSRPLKFPVCTGRQRQTAGEEAASMGTHAPRGTWAWRPRRSAHSHRRPAPDTSITAKEIAVYSLRGTLHSRG